MAALWHRPPPDMRTFLLSRRHRDWIASIVLACLCFQTYVPAGFMPASGAPFRLELCQEGRYAPLPGHPTGHAQDHGTFEHCPFGCAPAAGPQPAGIAVEPTAQQASPRVGAFEMLRWAAHSERAHQARGPPTPA